MAHIYNPQKLPENLDFHKATKDLPVGRATKTRLQLYLAQKSKDEVKLIIEQLQDMTSDALKRAQTREDHGHIIIPTNIVDAERRTWVQKAIHAKALMQFAQTYLDSLTRQQKI